MLVTIRGQEPAQRPGLPTFFAGGFRPFFLLGALHAVASLVAWVTTHAGTSVITSRWPAWWWHGHEMLFGFAVAAIAGFLLTAVPKWTKSPAPKGVPLAVLVVAWLLGRVAGWTSGLLPEVVLAFADQLFLLPLLVWAAWRVFGSGNRRNVLVVLVIAALAASDVLFHLQMMGMVSADRPLGLHAGVYVVVVLMTLISGRIVPSFTASALKRAGDETEVVTRPWVGRIAVAGAMVTATLVLAAPDSPALGGTALATALALIARSLGWRAARTLGDPLVWILHVGHAWLIVGFSLLAATVLADFGTGASALHAFTAGGIGTLVLAVTTRASLGHSGRELRVSAPVVMTYALVSLGALLRVTATFLPASTSLPWIVASGVLWALAFAGFAVLYWPVLTQPRVDGRPG